MFLLVVIDTANMFSIFIQLKSEAFTRAIHHRILDLPNKLERLNVTPILVL